MDRSSRQKINKETVGFKNICDQIDLIDIYTIYPKSVEHTFFSSAHRIISSIEYMLGQKSSLNKFKKIEIILNIFVDHNDMKLETNYRKKNREGTQNMWRLQQHATKKTMGH